MKRFKMGAVKADRWGGRKGYVCGIAPEILESVTDSPGDSRFASWFLRRAIGHP